MPPRALSVERLTDAGINDEFMKDAAKSRQPGTAGLFLLVRKMATDEVLADLKGVGGTVIRTSFHETKEAALREGVGRASGSGGESPTARLSELLALRSRVVGQIGGVR